MSRRDDLDERIKMLVYGKVIRVYTTGEFPTRNALQRLPDEERIDVVCERYKMWILDIAADLSANPDAGYAALALLNSYFEMIAQLSGYKPPERESCEKKKRDEDFVTEVEYGLKKVFVELEHEPEIAAEIRKRLRNPMAHMGVTQDLVIIIDEFDEPLVWGPYKGQQAIVINPRLWVKRISEHFEQFHADLRSPDPAYDDLRAAFLARIARKA